MVEDTVLEEEEMVAAVAVVVVEGEDMGVKGVKGESVRAADAEACVWITGRCWR